MRIAFRTDTPPITQGDVNSVIVKEEPSDSGPDSASNSNSREPSQGTEVEPYPKITDELEPVILDPEFPDQVMYVGPPLIKKKVIALLKKHKKIFA